MSPTHLDRWAEAFAGRRVLVLSGAGCSTPSGIPDYRGPTGRLRRRRPMTFDTFRGSEAARRRYWARAVVGWPRFAAARANPAHLALADLEARGVVTGIVTQNVDGLHGDAGSRNVVELHGSLHAVVCLGCGRRHRRSDVQSWMLAANPTWEPTWAAAAPDGDAHLPDDRIDTFVVAPCPTCGGILKPDVVFFGEAVPRPRVERVRAWVDACEALWVVGSSLAVFSGYRFVRRAAERGIPVGIVNVGPTRGDDLATLRTHADVAAFLPALARRLSPA
ncbi:MAG: NAD-dependent protein deacetylase [Deltaproteobacteria bacterium]|nr:MAG: NAD-dependent protein deacetylase [Deltaproteobacteria bacterium]